MTKKQGYFLLSFCSVILAELTTYDPVSFLASIIGVIYAVRGLLEK